MCSFGAEILVLQLYHDTTTFTMPIFIPLLFSLYFTTSSSLFQHYCDITQRYNESLYFDVIKLPHHGALQNCGKLLEVVDGLYFLLSTDGKHHSHPSKETLAKIVARSGGCTRFLFFNYENDMYWLFHREDFEDKYGYRSQIMEGALEIGGSNQ